MAPPSYPPLSIPANLDPLEEFTSTQNQGIKTSRERERWARGLAIPLYPPGRGGRRLSPFGPHSILCNVATKPTGLEEVWRFDCERPSVRPEYDEARAATVRLCGYKEGSFPFEVLVILGKPAIGKSVFLFLLLLRRLAAGFPTGLQICSKFALLLYKDGVLEFGRLNNGAPYSSLEDISDPNNRIWMLVDSNTNLTKPTGTFVDCEPFFVVLAASPLSDYIKWTVETKHHRFYMKPWSFSELTQP